MEKENRIHTHIKQFNPDVEIYNREHQDLLFEFDAGEGYYIFNDFITKDANNICTSGDGTTHLVWNIFYNDAGEEQRRELVAFYTLYATAIPYIDRIRKYPEEMLDENDLYDDKICGIPAVEIKMFAVDVKYQDIFFIYEGEDLPISAWIMRYIVNHVETIISDVMGLKAIFLHAVPEAEEFYKKNNFAPLLKNMNPLASIDEDFTPMYMSLREVVINFET